MTARVLLLSACVMLSATAAEPGLFAPAPLQLALPSSTNPAALRPPVDYHTLSHADRLRLEQLKPGMTRKQVAKQFEADGGLIPLPAERHYLRGSRDPKTHLVIMVEIAFRPAAMDEATFADERRCIEWFRDHQWEVKPDDVVMWVGVPYSSASAID